MHLVLHPVASASRSSWQGRSRCRGRLAAGLVLSARGPRSEAIDPRPCQAAAPGSCSAQQKVVRYAKQSIIPTWFARRTISYTILAAHPGLFLVYIPVSRVCAAVAPLGLSPKRRVAALPARSHHQP